MLNLFAILIIAVLVDIWTEMYGTKNIESSDQIIEQNNTMANNGEHEEPL